MNKIISICLGVLLSFSVVAEDLFDRESALQSFKAECQLELVLAMGLSSQKENGSSQKELRGVASKSKNPEIMNRMVDELFLEPELAGGTYMFYRLENCLISKAYKVQALDFELVRAPLKACDAKNLAMENIVGCIDSVLLNEYKKSNK